MSFEAKVYKILVASPGDVEDERKAIPEVISEWNNINAEASNVVLLPVKWETHSAPLMGDRAQGVINSQLVASCDMAIGVFWTRLGSPTGVSESGTAEELEWFIKEGKPTMIYFSSRQLDPTKLDLKQYSALKEFEQKMQKIGLTGSYSSITDFKEQLLRQLSINVQTLMSGEKVPAPTPELHKETVASIEKIIKEGQIYMENYEKDGKVKSFVVRGDTRGIKDGLKDLGGSWNKGLSGWIFPLSKKLEVAEFLKKSK
ncbi:hypothetical protein [Vibrio parahaemolyticus]|uniref:hypothetical protein n=1 Tax=Vibrio parahaemolyticus TaxID=670 RepID=UPI001121DEB6|nr:hypothetical protein [Vibrio parahaemolyticus]TOI73556.1 hypothetical protein CGI54_24695 [Vibrio parahaemolyticus]